MTGIPETDKAIDLLQQLGLKEYEAKCFVALSRMPKATAKEVNELSEVPRTRVYDAVRTLESKGIVEIQHSNPQQFRAVSVGEATATLRDEYESRTDALRETLQRLEPEDGDDGTEITHEVWSLRQARAIENRAAQLIEGAEDEVLLMFGDEEAWTEKLTSNLEEATDRDVTLVIATPSQSLRDHITAKLPGARATGAEVEWLGQSAVDGDDTEINRLVLVDRSSLLVSTCSSGEHEEQIERAVIGRGFDNGIVTLSRRLMATRLPDVGDSRTDAGRSHS